LRYCTTSRKVAGEIPDDVIDIILPALELTQPLTEMSIRDTSWGGGGKKKGGGNHNHVRGGMDRK